MSNFLKQYKKELEDEIMQFLFMCGNEDKRILILHDTKNNLDELVRLGCIALVFGYKKLFMKIASPKNFDVDRFLNRISELDGNFALVDGWLNTFIGNIENETAREAAREMWFERKSVLNNGDFKIQSLIC